MRVQAEHAGNDEKRHIKFHWLYLWVATPCMIVYDSSTQEKLFMRHDSHDINFVFLCDPCSLLDHSYIGL